MNTESIDRGFAFGPFTVLPRQRLLMESGRPVRLGSRALELLVVLIEKSGEVVGKAQLMAQVWPHSVVEEAALRVHMSALRKALGDGRHGRRFIATVPQRGYSFVGLVRRASVMHLAGCTCGASIVAAHGRDSAAHGRDLAAHGRDLAAHGRDSADTRSVGLTL